MSIHHTPSKGSAAPSVADAGSALVQHSGHLLETDHEQALIFRSAFGNELGHQSIALAAQRQDKKCSEKKTTATSAIPHFLGNLKGTVLINEQQVQHSVRRKKVGDTRKEPAQRDVSLCVFRLLFVFLPIWKFKCFVFLPDWKFKCRIALRDLKREDSHRSMTCRPLRPPAYEARMSLNPT
jgi:hypothetical protein